ncbi:Acyl-coenzyme A thioesterase 13 [Morella rubra]|uniref:Acyl-coenzyme A thioesterase 13 n=1 Tax=Morella rubra TaxID=262757 RepID=A0A6A1WSC3_9ROSI|nr:Acyl-coenzyme A thioesterase 13 [Morella rubra]
MELEAVKRYLEGRAAKNAATIDGLPLRFFERLTMQGLRVDLIEPGRLMLLESPRPFTGEELGGALFSHLSNIFLFKARKGRPNHAPPSNSGNFLHGGATATLVDMVGSAVIFTVGAPVTGVSVEINVSYLDAAYADEEIEIEARVLRVGKAVGVVSVELRKKKTGKIIAQGRHTKYLAISSKM